jgi:WD40 repeat protein
MPSSFVLSQLALDPNGRFLAAPGERDRLAVWDLRVSPPRALSCGSLPREVSTVAFSTGGTAVIAAADNGFVGIWRSQSGILLGAIEAQRGYSRPTAVAYNETRNFVACGYLREGTIALWDLSHGARPKFIGARHEHGMRSTIQALASDGAGTRLLSLDDNGAAVLWDLPSFAPLFRIPYSSDGYLQSLPMNTAGTLTVAGGRDSLRLHELSLNRWVERARALAGRELSDEERLAFLRPAK